MTPLPSSPGTRYFSATARLWLRINGTDYPLIAVTTNTSQNTIPTCEVVLPVGTNVSTQVRAKLPALRPQNDTGTETNRKIGDPKDLTGLTSQLQSAQVYIRLRGDAVPQGKWPETDVVLFDGALCGQGQTEIASQVHATLKLVHWLEQLDSASALSGTTHPGGATSATFRAVFGSPSGLTRPAFISDNYADAAILDPLNIQQDLWMKGLQPLFLRMTEENAVWLSAANSLCGEQLKNGNKEAAAALAKMNGTSKYAVPLKLAKIDGSGLLASNILAWLQGRINETIVTATLWEKLIGDLAPGLMFSVIPRVNDALVVPQQFACRDIWQTVYYGDTIELQTFRGARRPLRGVLAFSQGTDRSGFTSEEEATPGACFLPEAAGTGLVLHTVAPTWMSGLPLSAAKPSKTLFNRNGRGSGTSLPQAASAVAAQERADARELEADFYRRYAEWVYYSEAVRNSHCRVTGPLRFDICPGSTVSLKPLDAATARYTLQPHVAYVVGMTHHINAASHTASTTFELSHLRTEVENAESRFASDTHAIYDKLFVGAPLIDELAQLG